MKDQQITENRLLGKLKRRFYPIQCGAYPDYDKATGVEYNYFRDYDARFGRYVQSDPIGLAGGLNTYGYANGNPITWIDPKGLFGAYGAFGGSYNLGVGGIAKSGGYWSPDGGTSGAFTSTGKGWGYSASLGVELGLFFGDGTCEFEGNANYREITILGFSLGWGTNSNGDLISVNIAAGVGAPLAVEGGQSNTVLY